MIWIMIMDVEAEDRDEGWMRRKKQRNRKYAFNLN